MNRLVQTLLLFTILRTGEGIGAGSGPAFIGGSDSDQKDSDIVTKTYRYYINYRRLMGLNTLEDEQYYERWTEASNCLGACPVNSYCQDGYCVCNADDSYQQKYGQCYNDVNLEFVGDKEKFRKPNPPPRPEWCFCTSRNNAKEVCEQHRYREECQIPIYPNSFDSKSQFCRRADHSFCLTKDINMFCGEETLVDPSDRIEKNVCQCRQDMKFDTRNMECRLHIDVNCTNIALSEEYKDSNLTRVLTGEVQEIREEYSQTEITAAFCNLKYLDENPCSFNKGYSLMNIWACICSWFE